MDKFQILVLRALVQLLREIILSQRNREKTEILITEINAETGEMLDGPNEKGINEREGESYERSEDQRQAGS